MRQAYVISFKLPTHTVNVIRTATLSNYYEQPELTSEYINAM